MAKALKHMLASQVEADLDTSPGGILLIDPGTMTMESNEAFRKDLREKAGGARMRVLHNRTAKVAFGNRGFDGDIDGFFETLTGASAVVYGGDGPIPIAKVVRDWTKIQKDLKVKGAVADNEVLVGGEANALADMPDLEQLKGMLAGAIIGTARGIAVSLSAVFGGLARCIQARVDEGGGAPEEAEEAPAAEAPAEEAPAEEAPAEEAAPEGGDEKPEDTPAEEGDA